jgi:hypothetical protein
MGLVFIGVSYYSDDQDVEILEQSSKVKKDSRRPVDLVNEHLQKTYDKEVINKMNTINQNKVFAPKLKEIPEESPLTEEEISSLYGGASIEDLIRKDLNEKNAIEDKQYQSELERKEFEEQEEIQRKYREKYSKAFLEMTEKEGYQVELDENYRVKSVNKVAPTKKNYNSKRIPNRN